MLRLRNWPKIVIKTEVLSISSVSLLVIVNWHNSVKNCFSAHSVIYVNPLPTFFQISNSHTTYLSFAIFHFVFVNLWFVQQLRKSKILKSLKSECLLCFSSLPSAIRVTAKNLIRDCWINDIKISFMFFSSRTLPARWVSVPKATWRPGGTTTGVFILSSIRQWERG